MKKVIETVMIPTVVAEWIADDGTRFDKQWDCQRYEAAVAIRAAETSPDIKVWAHNDDNYPPFGGNDIITDNDFNWYMPLNENGIQLLKNAYPSAADWIDQASIEKWICIESNDMDDSWVSTLDCGIEYVKKVLSLFGYDVSIKPREVM